MNSLFSTTNYRKTILVLGESALLFVLVFVITSSRAAAHFIAVGHFEDFDSDDLAKGLLKAAVIISVCQICYFFNDLYDWRVLSNASQTSIQLLQSVVHSAIILAILFYLFRGVDEILASTCAEYLAAHPIMAALSLAMVYPVSYYYRITFRWTMVRSRLRDRLLFVGASPMSETLEHELSERSDPAYEVVGYVLETPSTTPYVPGGREILGSFEGLFETARRLRISHIIVTLPERRGKLPILDLLNCRLGGIRIEEGELFYERLTGKIAIEKLRPSYLIFSEGFYRSKFNYIFKRMMDVTAASTGLILSAPLALLTALAIKVTSPGPILFRQQRVGKEGKVFTLFKFRSMRVDAEKATGPVWATANDDRVTTIGRLLRRTRVDEIPQMINVLRNDMSFVGPRPERPFFVEELKKEIPYYTERLVVKPGITGWAQINYSYGASKDDAIQKLQYDLYYIKNMSIFLDIIIILRTIKVIVLRRGAV